MSHPTKQTLWRYATGELAVSRRLKIREHATGCVPCKSELHRAIAATRVLSGKGEDTPTLAEIDTWGRELLMRRVARTRLRPVHWVFALAGATAAVALVSILPGQQGAVDELASRGEKAAAPINLRVLCVSPEPPVEIREATTGCAAGSFLKILVGNNHSNRGRVAVFQVADGAVEPIYPAEFGDPLLQLPGSAEPMPGSKRVPEINPDTLRIVAVAMDEGVLSATDPLLSWAKTADQGAHANLFGRADAVVVIIDVTGATK